MTIQRNKAINIRRTVYGGISMLTLAAALATVPLDFSVQALIHGKLPLAQAFADDDGGEGGEDGGNSGGGAAGGAGDSDSEGGDDDHDSDSDSDGGDDHESEAESEGGEEGDDDAGAPAGTVGSATGGTGGGVGTVDPATGTVSWSDGSTFDPAAGSFTSGGVTTTGLSTPPAGYTY